MTTKRIPLARPLRPSVPDEVLDLFIEMRECRSSERWWDLHKRLAKLIPHKPWDWPVIEDPDDPPDWRPNESARARWRELAALVDERGRARDIP